MNRQVMCVTFFVSLVLEVSLVLGQADPGASPEDSTSSTGRIVGISKYLQDLVQSGELPGAVAIVAHRGKVVLHEAVGLAERAPQRPMKRDAIFRMASMTKPITTVAVMMLVEEGRLSLDEPVAKHIPEFANPMVLSGTGNRPASREITIRQLLTHTSGLGYLNTHRIGQLYEAAEIEGGVRRSVTSLDENIRRLAKLPLVSDPGGEFNYGMSTDVLGLVVERVSGMELDTFVEEKVCKPLGMNDTFFTVPAAKQARIPACFVADGVILREISDSEEIQNGTFRSRMAPDHAFPPKHRYLSGGGGLCSTAADYVRFCQMILNRGELDGIRLLKPATVEMMTTNQIGGLTAGVGDVTYKFGFGFAVFPDADGSEGEVGWGGIWGTVFRISKDRHWVGLLLTQRVLDESFFTRDADFTRTVRHAIQGN